MFGRPKSSHEEAVFMLGRDEEASARCLEIADVAAINPKVVELLENAKDVRPPKATIVGYGVLSASTETSVPVGVGFMHDEAGGLDAWVIDWVQTVESQRRQGIGSSVVSLLVAKVRTTVSRDIRVTASCSSAAAEKFFLALEFERGEDGRLYLPQSAKLKH